MSNKEIRASAYRTKCSLGRQIIFKQFAVNFFCEIFLILYYQNLTMKAKKIITIIITVITGLLIAFSGISKLIGTQQVNEVLSKFGVLDYRIWLGLMEIGFVALFIYPKTIKIGFILLSCYFGGALATELSHQSTFNALLPIVLVWVTAFLRDPGIFLPAGDSGKTA